MRKISVVNGAKRRHLVLIEGKNNKKCTIGMGAESGRCCTRAAEGKARQALSIVAWPQLLALTDGKILACMPRGMRDRRRHDDLIKMLT